jgi:hypothetical protein
MQTMERKKKPRPPAFTAWARWRREPLHSEPSTTHSETFTPSSVERLRH